MKFPIARLSILALVAGLGLAGSAQEAFADANSTITVNCKAYTQTYNGTKIGAWTSGYCGALVTFVNGANKAQLQRYIACNLKVGKQESTCSVTKSHKQLGIPDDFHPIGEYAPDLPNKYLASGAWYAYANPPLRGVTSSAIGYLDANGNPVSGSAHRTITIEHQLLNYY